MRRYTEEDPFSLYLPKEASDHVPSVVEDQGHVDVFGGCKTLKSA